MGAQGSEASTGVGVPNDIQAMLGVDSPVVMTLGRGRGRAVYEALMIVLALAVVWLLTMPNRGAVFVVNAVIWAVFVIDYFLRLAMSTDRRLFFRRNIPDLIAILPLDFFRLARLARLARLMRLVRAGSVLWRVSKDVRGVLGTNGLAYVMLFALTTIFAGALAVWAVEPAITSFGDAVWWSIVTATTVGYGDISPGAPLARVVAVVLMLVGIGTLGMITGSIATYFIEDRKPSATSSGVGFVREQLGRWHELAPEERRETATILSALVEQTASATLPADGGVPREASPTEGPPRA